MLRGLLRHRIARRCAFRKHAHVCRTRGDRTREIFLGQPRERSREKCIPCLLCRDLVLHLITRCLQHLCKTHLDFLPRIEPDTLDLLARSFRKRRRLELSCFVSGDLQALPISAHGATLCPSPQISSSLSLTARPARMLRSNGSRLTGRRTSCGDLWKSEVIAYVWRALFMCNPVTSWT